MALCVILVAAPACCKAMLHEHVHQQQKTKKDDSSTDISRRCDRLLRYISWLAGTCAGQIYSTAQQAMLFDRHHRRHQNAVKRAAVWIKGHADWSASTVTALHGALVRGEGEEEGDGVVVARPAGHSRAPGVGDIHSRLFAAATEDGIAEDMRLLHGHSSALRQVR